MEPVLVLGDPKGALHVLNDASKYHRPAMDKQVLDMWFGRSLLSSEGDDHSRRRKRLSPAFTQSSVKEISSIFFELSHRLSENWDDKLSVENEALVDVSKQLHTFSLDAISMTMFAYNLSASTGTIPELLSNISNGPSQEDTLANRLAGLLISSFPSLLAMPNPMKTWATKLRTELGAIAKDVWDNGIDGVEVGMNARVLEVLRQSSKDGETMTRDEAVAEIIGILFAGSETVANVMGELLFELAHNPDIQSKLRAELIAFEQKHGGPPTYNDIVGSGKSGLEYLEAVTRETMRCKAVLMDIARQTVEDDIIPLSIPLPGSGQTSIEVPAGTTISIPIREGLNIEPSIWGDNARDFVPERWLQEGVGERGVGIGGVLTFGDGAKVCIGRNFALAELKILVSNLLRRFEFSPPKDAIPVDFYHLGGNTVKPKLRGRESEGVQLPLIIRRI